ncbi:UvrD-helicase domain-containing protein [Streptomyces sp. GS7]|uniref:UvrD-helicase domain-containing protein n=1 Tax=Streptomyces sp. GS7 TaxID=2692234 RepID=UPI001316C6FA|nr:UvrD-helicase domain-containing protein [Streptomyces sp. GS7]QHC21725.1 UvrD-helicase domain-containing protein [Streptomyces sp. GS7]
MHTPTPEQTAAADAFPTGAHLVIQAGAGTGKTTTLAMLAHSAQRMGRLGRYIAFNRTVARHASRTFPAEVACGTAHALAYAAVGRYYQARMNAPRQAGWRTGAALGIDDGMYLRIGPRKVNNKALSHTALRTVTRFCHSADKDIAHHHVPPLRGAESEPLHAQLADLVLPYARKAWADLQNPDHGVVRFEHDHYLKMWALSEPVIPADFLLLDEAQDTNPVVEQVLTAQRDHAQLVLVGDSAQAIYGWRGARDVMTGFDGTQLSLSHSFRFGPALAAEANRWLAIVDAPIRLSGSPHRTTELRPLHTPEAILCRTNVGAMVAVIRQLEANHRVALAGGGEALRSLARAAHDLESGRRTAHPELMLFESWAELREYAEFDPAGRDLLPLVELVDEHGTAAVLHALDRLSPEESAQVTVSTAHRAKGREWTSVCVADDFTGPDDLDEADEDGTPLPGPIDVDEARLAYVAVTRARTQLDIGGLSWINSHPAGDPRPTGRPTESEKKKDRTESPPKRGGQRPPTGRSGKDGSQRTGD